MANAAIVILAGTEGHANAGRLVNGLEAAKKFVETDGNNVELSSAVQAPSGFPNSKKKTTTTTNFIGI
jgi:hypothetical protein